MAGISLQFYLNDGSDTFRDYSSGNASFPTLDYFRWSREGYNFLYWNTASDGSGTTYYADAPIPESLRGGGGPFYAIWEAVSPSVTYYITNSTELTSVANAIRTKGGTSSSLVYPAGFVSAIGDIPTGITPTGTKSITTNGTHDVTNYASASVAVPASAVDSGTKSITTNGTHDVVGYASASVNVPSSSPTLISKSITANGTYNASADSADGYSSVTVNVPSSGGIITTEVANATGTTLQITCGGGGGGANTCTLTLDENGVTASNFSNGTPSGNYCAMGCFNAESFVVFQCDSEYGDWVLIIPDGLGHGCLIATSQSFTSNYGICADAGAEYQYEVDDARMSLYDYFGGFSITALVIEPSE